MGQPGRRKVVVVLCIAAVLLAGLMPGAATADLVVPEPAFILLPDLSTRALPCSPDPPAEYQAPDRSPEYGRAPPHTHA
jgi:hypothetical protein